MTVNERVVAARSELSPAEARVAAQVLAAPPKVAFGTVAELARRAGTGTATVVRFTTKVGYRGFSDLQASVRAEMSESLRPAAERIREPAARDLIDLTLHAELDNVRATLHGVDRQAAGLIGSFGENIGLQLHGKIRLGVDRPRTAGKLQFCAPCHEPAQPSART